ncbi:MAG: tetratricopeptide repeat protein [Spirochaetaceae bacterium]|nr:tetratricopeptide repeat protein [Spirochaetaceae bacterium]
MIRVWYVVFVIVSIPVYAQLSSSENALRNYRNGRAEESAGNTALANRYYNEAIRLCTDDIKRNAATNDSYTILTWSLQRQKKYHEVISWAERGLQLFITEYRLCEIMGEAYFYLDDYGRSLQYMQYYVNNVPQDESVATAYFFMGDIFRLQRQYLKADIAYLTALQLRPGVTLWWYRLGVAREANTNYVEALTAYEQVIRLDPNYPGAQAGINRCRRHL